MDNPGCSLAIVTAAFRSAEFSYLEGWDLHIATARHVILAALCAEALGTVEC